jgi:hypothetical protein
MRTWIDEGESLMKRDEVLGKLKQHRAEFDRRVAAIPAEALDLPAPGCAHSPKQIVAHVSAYEALVVERLRAARLGEQTEFDRDRVSWEAFNDRIWLESAEKATDGVLYSSSRGFLALLEEVAALSGAELTELTGVTASIDPAWLKGKSLAELIGIDCFEHYPAHFAQLEAAAQSLTLDA